MLPYEDTGTQRNRRRHQGVTVTILKQEVKSLRQVEVGKG